MRQFVLAACCFLMFGAAAFTQQQQQPPTARDYCVKVAPGKSAEFEAFLHDVSVPLNQSRANAGEFEWFLAERAAIPAGSSAKCDYRIVYGYKGLPPETPSSEQMDAALKKAKINMSAKDWAAKRDALTQLVDVEIWYYVDAFGPSQAKGSYLRFNHYNIKPGAMQDWQRLETTYWKPMVQEYVKGGGKGFWGVMGLAMPEGDNLPYNAGTIDVFPDWNSLLQGVPFSLWPKVHPNTDATEVFDRLDKVRSRASIEIYKIIELVNRASN
jgi:hypothetical protein